MAHGSNKAVIAALIANLGIALAKFVGFALTGAASMLAEAVHSCADSGNQALLLLGLARGGREATDEHPFGFGAERYFWSFVVALVIFALGSVFAMYEGISKLFHPHPLTSPLIAVGILVVAIALEGWSFHTAVGEARHVKGKLSWMAFIQGTKQAELPVVMLEDLGALLGLVIALAGVGLSVLTGDSRFDAMGSIVIGVLLGIIALVLSIKMKSLLIGEAATLEDREKISAAFTSAPSVRRVIHMRTLHLGPEELLVAAKIEFDPALDLAELSAAIDAAEARVRAVLPIAERIYIEPDLYDVRRTAAVTSG